MIQILHRIFAPLIREQGDTDFMIRQCPHCHDQTIAFQKMLAIAFGMSVKCSNCRSKVHADTLLHAVMSMLLVVLTVALFVLLGNRYGMAGIMMAFVIPVIIDVIGTMWMPLTAKRQGVNQGADGD